MCETAVRCGAIFIAFLRLHSLLGRFVLIFSVKDIKFNPFVFRTIEE
jgi:hypothetical protein